MSIRSTLIGAIAVAGLAAAPRAAYASQPPQLGDCTNSPNVFSATLGLGGSFFGCFSGTVGRLGEDALLNSTAYFFAGVTSGPATNDDGTFVDAPVTPGQALFTTNCGSGGNGTFAFCNGTHSTSDDNLADAQSIFNAGGEGVFAIATRDSTRVPLPDKGYYSYTGDASRNSNPIPDGFQAVLLQVQIAGVDDVGHFVLGWEDLNSGCTHESNNIEYIDSGNLSNGAYLNSILANCDTNNPGGNTGDEDYNDIYFDIQLASVGIPTENPTPEPMTMSMMAFGLVAMGGASFRRRKNSK